MKLQKLLPSILGVALVLLSAAPAPSAQRVSARAYHGQPSYSSSRVWIPGRFETVHQRVWVPGWTERVWIDPAFEWRFGPCGSRIRVQVCAGRWKSVHHPGHYEIRAVQVWQAGHWVARYGR